MGYVPTLKTRYKEQIKPALMKEFGYSSVMQCPKLEKIVINQGMGQAVADKKLIDVAEARSPARRPFRPVRARTSPTSSCVRACLSACA